MSREHDPAFAGLPRQKADELEWNINEAERKGEVLVINPDKGVVGTTPVNLVSPNANTTGLVRYGRHYGDAMPR
ncbi:MAG: hypothetical protein PCFJNLEI_01611 [Verrucomicrobiae bacterium]|nr:hypothetical protein [Verrucomicrobiae bacterium]